MRFRIFTLAAVAALIAVAPAACPAKTKKIHDDQKEKQWLSMENGPWWFAPDWYYYFLHKNYSGAEMYWKWAGFKSGYRVRFKERQKLAKVEKERVHVESLYKEELAREADRAVDVTYSIYKDEFSRMQDCIADGLLYCLNKSKGKMKYQVDELSRQNEVICANIAYIHKQGVGYGLENAKRQQAYEEAKTAMGELVSRTARLAAVAATHY